MKWKKTSNMTSYLPIASFELDNLCSCYRAKSSLTHQKQKSPKRPYTPKSFWKLSLLIKVMVLQLK